MELYHLKIYIDDLLHRAVGLTRPRPIINAAPNMGFNPYYPSGNYSYSYYIPKYPY